MHGSLHRVKKITLREIEPLRDNGAAEGPIYNYIRRIVIEYEDVARVELVCHSDDPKTLYLSGYVDGRPDE